MTTKPVAWPLQGLPPQQTSAHAMVPLESLRICLTQRNKRPTISILPLATYRPSRRWEDNIKTYRKEIGCEGLVWIKPIQDIV
jgi:hypothetical protein